MLPAGNVVQAATVVHTSGAKKHTAAVQVPVPAPQVFATIVRLLEEEPDNIIESHNDKAFLIEILAGLSIYCGPACFESAIRDMTIDALSR